MNRMKWASSRDGTFWCVSSGGVSLLPPALLSFQGHLPLWRTGTTPAILSLSHNELDISAKRGFTSGIQSPAVALLVPVTPFFMVFGDD
jgi:hypothetical protein